jgi:hypothetical protein
MVVAILAAVGLAGIIKTIRNHFGISETVLKPIMVYDTHLFPLEKTNFKRNIARYYFQNKHSLMKIYKHSKLIIGFKTVSQLFLHYRYENQFAIPNAKLEQD